jgi:hypothetical protein
MSNVQLNDIGQVISYDFDATCISTSEHYSGRIFNIQYRSGYAVAYDATI